MGELRREGGFFVCPSGCRRREAFVCDHLTRASPSGLERLESEFGESFTVVDDGPDDGPRWYGVADADYATDYARRVEVGALIAERLAAERREYDLAERLRRKLMPKFPHNYRLVRRVCDRWGRPHFIEIEPLR